MGGEPGTPTRCGAFLSWSGPRTSRDARHPSRVLLRVGGGGLERTCRSRRCWGHSRTSPSRTSGPNNAREGHSRPPAFLSIKSEARRGHPRREHQVQERASEPDAFNALPVRCQAPFRDEKRARHAPPNAPFLLSRSVMRGDDNTQDGGVRRECLVRKCAGGPLRPRGALRTITLPGTPREARRAQAFPATKEAAACAISVVAALPATTERPR